MRAIEAERRTTLSIGESIHAYRSDDVHTSAWIDAHLRNVCFAEEDRLARLPVYNCVLAIAEQRVICATRKSSKADAGKRRGATSIAKNNTPTIVKEHKVIGIDPGPEGRPEMGFRSEPGIG